MLGVTSAAEGTRPVRARLLALGNPTLLKGDARTRARQRGIALDPLPEAEEEVRAIARLYGPRNSEVWVEAAAAEDRFKSAARSYDVLHVATHGLLDDDNPMFSALVLAAPPSHAEDGLLEAREIADLQLSARLAVLSACDTGRGRIGNGEGVVGLAWAFLASGVPQLVVSDWKTDSAATAVLMVAFHRELLSGRDAVEALRRAQATVRAKPAYTHPYYWAPFVVVGSGSK
jgi:CHAT domain-containing protein